MASEIKLKIADIVIRLSSRAEHRKLSPQEEKEFASGRYTSFFYRGRRKPDIEIKVFVVRHLPETKGSTVFVVRHFQDRSQNWRLHKEGNGLVYRCPLPGKEQCMVMNDRFDRVRAYVRRQKNKNSWQVADIIYDFLQVLIIQYLALHQKGFIAHSVGITDTDKRGLLFCGKSGAGKSTMARLWSAHTQAKILNDDRVIVRKKGSRYYLHSSPWHGEFKDYLYIRVNPGVLQRIYFIHHARKNQCAAVMQQDAFRLLYPAMFPPFWDKVLLEQAVEFAWELVRSVPCVGLGFVKDKRIIDYIRQKAKHDGHTEKRV